MRRRYSVVVYITCETREQAETVIAERIAFDEDYGFAYEISHGEVSR